MTVKRVIASLLVVAAVAGCTSVPDANPKLLRIGTAANLPPITYKSNGRLSGLEVDFGNRLSAAMNREAHFVVMPFDELIPALKKGKIDIVMSGMSITRLRALNLRFCDPYLRIGHMALIRTKDRNVYRDTRAMPILAKSVAVIKGSTGESIVRKVFSKSRIVAMNDVRDAADDLAAGKVDLIIADAPLIVQMAVDHESDGLEVVPHFLNREELAWAVSGDNPALQREANAVLTKWIADGLLDDIIRDWLPYADRYDLSPIGPE